MCGKKSLKLKFEEATSDYGACTIIAVAEFVDDFSQQSVLEFHVSARILPNSVISIEEKERIGALAGLP